MQNFTNIFCCLSLGFISVKRYPDQGNASKGKHLVGAVSHLITYHYGKKYGGMQADIMLEQEVRVLHLDPKATRKQTGILLQAELKAR